MALLIFHKYGTTDHVFCLTIVLAYMDTVKLIEDLLPLTDQGYFLMYTTAYLNSLPKWLCTKFVYSFSEQNYNVHHLGTKLLS